MFFIVDLHVRHRFIIYNSLCLNVTVHLTDGNKHVILIYMVNLSRGSTTKDFHVFYKLHVNTSLWSIYELQNY